MRNLKKILALALALVMTLSLMTVANAFTDDSAIDADYTEAVEVLNGMGVFQGRNDGSFDPTANITRAEVAAIIYRVVTGDVNNRLTSLYEEWDYFDDVTADKWYAGYVNFCANATYIKGRTADIFDPEADVTGYEVLAMILRAVGYDVNDEWTGTGWEIKVAATGESLDVTDTVGGVSLSAAATREVVAELLFRTVAYVPAVTYLTNTMSYWPIGDTLGEKEFGLKKYAGYVVGNQATGESATKLSETNPGAGVTGATNLTYTSGLELFGHAVSGWYCDPTVATRPAGVSGATEGDVFRLVDAGTSTTVTKDVYNAQTNKAEYFSVSYDDITATSGVWDYNVFVSNPGAADDVLIQLDLDIAQYTAINNYTTNPYLTVFSGHDNATQNILLAKATGYQDLALGTLVNVLTVTGTNGASAAAYPQKQISALGTISGVTVTYIDSATLAATLNTGATVGSSSSTHKGYAKNVSSAIDITGGLKFNTNYVIYTDLFGNYVGAQEISDNSYAKLTYAWYETVVSTGEHTYYGKVVRNNGTVETVTLDITNDLYNRLVCSKLNWGTANVVDSGTPMDVVLKPTANGNAIVHYNLSADTAQDGANHTDGSAPCYWYADVVEEIPNMTTVVRHIANGTSSWTVTSTTTALGTSMNYFVDDNTRFVVISGTDGNPTTTTYTGVAALLQGNQIAQIPADSVVTYTQVYSANIGSYNYHVDYVLIEDLDLVPASSLIYFEDGQVVGTDGTNNYYDVYIDGVKYQLPVDENSVAVTGQTFYTYKLVNGVYVLQADATTGCVENYELNNSEGVEYLYVYDGTDRYVASADAKIINLTGVENLPTTAAALMDAAETNTITVDVEIVSNQIVNVYIVGYQNSDGVNVTPIADPNP